MNDRFNGKMAKSRFEEIHDLACEAMESGDVVHMSFMLGCIREVALGYTSERSKYNIRMIKLMSYKNERVFDIDELKKELDCEEYENFAHFRRVVLDKLHSRFSYEIAEKERKKVTKLKISYDPLL